jgi:hypothetical protein
VDFSSGSVGGGNKFNGTVVRAVRGGAPCCVRSSPTGPFDSCILLLTGAQCDARGGVSQIRGSECFPGGGGNSCSPNPCLPTSCDAYAASQACCPCQGPSGECNGLPGRFGTCALSPGFDGACNHEGPGNVCLDMSDCIPAANGGICTSDTDCASGRACLQFAVGGQPGECCRLCM